MKTFREMRQGGQRASAYKDQRSHFSTAKGGLAAKTLSGPAAAGDGGRGGWSRPTGAHAALPPHPTVLSPTSPISSHVLHPTLSTLLLVLSWPRDTESHPLMNSLYPSRKPRKCRHSASGFQHHSKRSDIGYLARERGGSPLLLWVLGVKLWLLGLVPRIFTHRVILTPQKELYLAGWEAERSAWCIF